MIHISISIMNLLAKRTGLIVLSALLIFSCKQKEKIGLELNSPDHKIGTFFTDTLTLQTYAILKNDSIPTHNTDYCFVGAYKDPILGPVYGQTFAQLVLRDAGKVLDNFVVESVYMNLAYNYYYGDTTENQTVNIHRLTGAEPLEANKVYYSTRAPLSYNPTPHNVTTDWQLRPEKNGYRANIQLTNAFGNEIVEVYKANPNNADFHSAFKGIALIPKDEDKGALFTIKLSENENRIVVKGRVSGTSDPDSLVLFINLSGARFSRVIGNRSGTELSGLVETEDSINTFGKIYMQCGTGIRAGIRMPHLNSLKSTLGNIAINKAELVIQVDPTIVTPTPTSYLRPNFELKMLKLNKSGNVRQYYSNGAFHDDKLQYDLYPINGHDAPLHVIYNWWANTYTFDISTYFNAMVQDVEPNNGLIIAPLDDYNAAAVSRFKAEAGKVKLRVYYTKVE